jgi:hypothetical protein
VQHELIDEVIKNLALLQEEGNQRYAFSASTATKYIESLRLYRQQAEAVRLNLIEATKREANAFRNIPAGTATAGPDLTVAAIHAMRDICLALAGQSRPSERKTNSELADGLEAALK